jgi:hypothetical protein
MLLHMMDPHREDTNHRRETAGLSNRRSLEQKLHGLLLKDHLNQPEQVGGGRQIADDDHLNGAAHRVVNGLYAQRRIRGTIAACRANQKSRQAVGALISMTLDTSTFRWRDWACGLRNDSVFPVKASKLSRLTRYCLPILTAFKRPERT